MDTNQTTQTFGFGLEIPTETEVSLRVRQYTKSDSEGYHDAVEWETLSSGELDTI